MIRTIEEQIERYKTALGRHRGPYRLAVWRPTPVTKDNPHGQKMEWVDTSEPVEDMVMYLGDPRDEVVTIDVWSDGEMMYVTQGRRRDFGFPELAADRMNEGGTDDMAKKKTADAKQATAAAGKPAEAPKARGREYEVTDGATGPAKGDTAMAVWALFKKYNPATVQEVYDRTLADPNGPKPSKDTVASCASTFKKEGWLK